MENETPTTVHPLESETVAGSAFGPPPGPAQTTAFGAPPHSGTYVPPSDIPPAPRRQGAKTWVAGALAALVFGLGGFFGIQAVTSHSHSTTANGPGGGSVPGTGPGGNFPGRGGPGFRGAAGTFGTIESISGSALTVATRNSSSVTVTASSSTTVTKAAAGTVSDITVGDHVAVQGTSASGGVAADRVTDSKSAAPASGPAGIDVAGTVTTVGSGTFTVDDGSGTNLTVITSSATSFTVIQPSSLSSLAVGDTVMVTGTATNNTVAATSIESGAIRPFGPGGPRGGPGGGFGGPPNA